MNSDKTFLPNLAELPHNDTSEQAILSILVLNTDLIKTTISELKSEDFYVETHRILYQIIFEETKKNVPLSQIILINILKEKGIYEKIKAKKLIENLFQGTENISSLPYHINNIKEKKWRRTLIELGQKIIHSGFTTSKSFETILDEIDEKIYFLNQQNSSHKIYTSGEVVDSVFSEMQLKLQKDENTGYFSSFNDFDAIVQGFQNSDLIIIAGRPSMGKTAFALNLGQNIVEKYRIPLILFSLEMSRTQVMYRFLSKESNVPSTRLKAGRMDPDEWTNLGNSMKKISKLPIYIDDSSTLSIQEIRFKLKKILGNKNRPALVIIDYLQLMKGNEFSKNSNRVEEISSLTRNLKILAKEFEIPILLLSQLSRNVESRVNKRPLLSDLRESGSIEQDADIVIMLYRDEYYKIKTSTPNLTEFIVLKHRNGMTGTAKLNFDSYRTSFQNFENAKNQT